MKLSRRQFIGLTGMLGLSSCAKLGIEKADLTRLKPDLDLKLLGGNGPFTFATINDLHVLDAKSTAIVNRAVNSINENTEVDFTLMLGDMGTDGTLEEMKLAQSALARLDKPCFCIPGNHDVDPTQTDEYANYDKVFERRDWVEDGNAWAFIGINTCNGVASDVTVPEDRMEWLQKRLRGIKKTRPIALLAHHPFNPNTKAYRVQNAGEVLALFGEHNLKLVAAGHYHGNQIEERDGILFVTTACCSSTRDNFDGTSAKGYRVYHADGETLTHEFIEVRG